MFYSEYKGRCVGRLIFFIDNFYCKYHPGKEHFTYGEGKVNWDKSVVARYEWIDDTDIPKFTFFDTLNFSGENPSRKEYAERLQFFILPYVKNEDGIYIADQIEWIVQEVRRILTFDEGVWLIKCWEDEDRFNFIEEKLRTKIVNKIESEVRRITKNTEFSGTTMWRHIALCTVYEQIKY